MCRYLMRSKRRPRNEDSGDMVVGLEDGRETLRSTS